jgi:hypothetical protein
VDIPQHEIYDFGLFLIDQDLRLHGFSLASFPSMPPIHGDWQRRHDNPHIVEQLNYSTDEERRIFDNNVALLNTEQHNAFEKIYHSTSTQDGNCFFLHGAGGTGKTFVYSTVCHRVRANSWIVLCVVSSGIALLLLPGGHTTHSTFCIPIHGLCQDSWCQIDKKSKLADMLREVRLIIWDEAVTQHRYNFCLTFFDHLTDNSVTDTQSKP